MDSHTLEILEFDAVRRQIADLARSSLGKELAARLAPAADAEAVRDAIGKTSEMVELLEARMTPPMAGLRDVRLWVRRAALGVQLDVGPLREIRDVAELTGLAYEYWLRLTPDSPRIERLLSDVADLRPLARTIDDAIDERGRVRSSAAPELERIRGEIAGHESRIHKEIQKLLRQSDVRGALRYPQPTMSGDHHVLAVAVNHRHKVAGVVHRTSASGETVYIEPSKVSEISAELSLLRSAEQREIRRVLRRLSEGVAARSEDLLRAIDVLAELDLATAKAQYSRLLRMTAPEIVEEGPLRLDEARHPLLEWIFAETNLGAAEGERKTVVPVSVRLGGAFDVLVVTGPNTGGKTVVLKTAGLLAVMALSGLHIPARAGSVVPMFDDVLADVGDEQSLQQSLSTFSSHVTRIAEILRRAGRRTLVLLDELGAGTDPAEGAALGEAILDELVDLGAKALVTTHLGDLKSYALRRARVENAAVEFDPQTLRPTYRLLIGRTGESCALRVAKRLGAPRRLLARAYRSLRRRQGRRSGEESRLQEMRAAAEQAREEALAAGRLAAEAEAEFKRRRDQLQQEADVQREIERFRTTLQPGDSVRVVRFDRNGVVRRVDRNRGLAAVEVGKVEWELPLADLFPAPR
jgi:DNA mismatch repair protein MutS2